VDPTQVPEELPSIETHAERAADAAMEALPSFKPVSQGDLKHLMKMYKKRIARLETLKSAVAAAEKVKAKKKTRKKIAKASKKKNRSK
jgi:hypothetical protein